MYRVSGGDGGLCLLRSVSCRALHRDLKNAPLLRGFYELLLEQLPVCSHKSLSSAAFALDVFVQLRCLRPSDELLAALDAEVQFRLAGEAGQHVPGRQSTLLNHCTTEVLSVFRHCARPASAALQRLVAAALLETCAHEQRAAHSGGAQALTPRQAENLLRAWVAFAAVPGAPALETLPAVQQALEGPLAGDARQLRGAAGVLHRALTDQLRAAKSVQAVADLCASLGVYFSGTHACTAICKLARLCAPASNSS